jgi:hypothetical protein
VAEVPDYTFVRFQVIKSFRRVGLAESRASDRRKKAETLTVPSTDNIRGSAIIALGMAVEPDTDHFRSIVRIAAVPCWGDGPTTATASSMIAPDTASSGSTRPIGDSVIIRRRSISG